MKISKNTSFSSIDLGTNKDSQYIVAETALSKILSGSLNTSFIPNTANLIFALGSY